MLARPFAELAPHAGTTIRTLGRRGAPVLVVLSVCLLLFAASVRAQDDGLFHYEPPSADVVYPLEGEIVQPAVPAPQPAPTAEPAKASAPAASLPPVTLPPEEPASDGEYGAQAAVKRVTPGPHEVPLQSARDLPGAFGDPLRILDSLPGVTPIASGVPYVYVRGAPPAATGYVFDDIPLPQLFHGAFGPAVIHPRATGPVRFYAGVPPARYGRRAGGLLLAEGLPPPNQFGAELELRLLDVGAWVASPVGSGNVSVSGRIGYPKLAILASQALGIVEPGTSFNYWDGQVRYNLPLNRRDHVELVWLGSFDSINLPGISNNPRAGTSRLEFHRVETRLVHRLHRGELGSALRFGYDGSELGDALTVHSFTVGPRMWARLKLGRHSLRFGGDLYASKGEVIDGAGTLASPQGDIDVGLPKIAQAPARNQGGVYAETDLATTQRTRLELGARLDYWSVQSKITLAVDPRVRFTFDVTPDFDVHAAFGLAHQPAVFLLPVPGLTDVALDKGLTSSIQSEVGAGYDLNDSTRFEVQTFVHKYRGLLLPELVTDGAVRDDPPLSSALAYGVEVFLRRNVGERVSGWISYTLGRAKADSGPEVIGKFSPDFDVRHVINAVAQWRIWRGLQLGGRVQARSGRLIEQLNPRYEQRLPWFVRADMRIGYKWRGRWADMTAYFEWLNFTVRREYLDADCFFGSCKATLAPPISLPNLGIRAEL